LVQNAELGGDLQVIQLDPIQLHGSFENLVGARLAERLAAGYGASFSAWLPCYLHRIADKGG
jgi:hypothetical protein